MYRVVALVALLACGRVGFDAGTSGGDDAPGDGGPAGDGALGDGAMIDAPGGGGVNQTSCTPPSVSCTFPGGLPCSCWGTRSFQNAGMNESSGTLSITPNANTAGASGQCLRMATPFTAPGALIEVSQVLVGAQSATTFQIGFPAAEYRMTVLGAALTASDVTGPIKTTTYDPSAHRWWRIRPEAGTVIFETAPDGKQWTTLVVSTQPATASYPILVSAGTPNAQAAPGVAKIEGINVCPP